MIPAIFEKQVGAGRELNDANNNLREIAIVSIINRKLVGEEWLPISTELSKFILNRLESLGLPSTTTVSAVKRGGRKYNWDFDIIYGTHLEKTEFKFGGITVQSLPEFFSCGANKPFNTCIPYATYFYRNYLTSVAAIYNIPVEINEEDYLKSVYGSTYKGIFKQLYDSEKQGTEAQKRMKKELVDSSINAWLCEAAPLTDLNAITQEFKRSQEGKKFMLFNNGTFHEDEIKSEELVATCVKGIKLSKYLIIQSAVSSTTYEMLLRWKNHAGVLYPAWQISMKR